MRPRRFRVWNFSADSDYHTQRNNMVIPHASCAPTAMIMALKQAGIDLQSSKNEQPEDYLTRFLQSPSAYREMRERASWAFDRRTGKPLYPPNEVHVMLTWAANRLARKLVSVFDTKWDLTTLVHVLVNGSGIVLSGLFPMSNGGDLNHVVSLAGFRLQRPATAEELLRDSQASDRVESWIIDDPYGNWRKDYRDHHGNNISMSTTEWASIIKPIGSRSVWAHVVGPSRDSTREAA